MSRWQRWLGIVFVVVYFGLLLWPGLLVMLIHRRAAKLESRGRL